MPGATATRPKSQRQAKTGTAARTTSPAPQVGVDGAQAQPYFSYQHVQREARIQPNKSAVGFSVQIREVAGEYGNLGQWKNADALPLWALKPLLEQCGFLSGSASSAAPTTIAQQTDGSTSVDMTDKVGVGSSG